MSKDKISDYSATANSNTDIGGINIDEGCAPSGINDAIRTLMKQLKDWQSGSQDVYIHPAGSASVPSITATGDTNTGLFFPAADTVGITTGGTERARVDSSGNLGLGVTPSAWLSTRKVVQNGNAALVSATSVPAFLQLSANTFTDSGGTDKYISTAAATNYAQVNGQHQWFYAASGSAGATATFTQAMTLDASGNLFVGATSAGFAEKFRVYGNYSVFDNGTFTGFIGSGSSLGTGTGSDFAIRSSNAIAFLAGGATERARIDSSGNLLIGTTDPGDTTGNGVKIYPSFAGVPSLRFVGNSTASNVYPLMVRASSNNTWRFYLDYSGNLYAQNTTITSLSDARLKENIRDLDVGLSEIMALKPRKFDWKKGKGSDTKDARGFIAQEIEQVFPDMVGGWADEAPEGEEPYKSVRADLIPVLVKAIQEQQAIITQLQAQLTSVSADVAALKGNA